MSERRRAAITGMGTVNASTAGGRDAVAGALALGRSAIAPVTAFAVEGRPSRLAALVEDGTLAGLIERDQARRLSRIGQLTVAASQLAVRDAVVDGGPGLAIVVGTEHGDFRSSAEFADGFLRRGPSGLSPMIFPNTVMNAMASVAAIAIGAKAPSITLNQPTVAGDLAVARAVELIAAGRAEAVVAGGVDEVWETVYRRLAEMGVLSPAMGAGDEGCFPYESRHNGPVLGEGATFVVLEDLQIARARGARVLAEVTHVAWGNVPASPHAAPSSRADAESPVARMLDAYRGTSPPFGRCYGAGNGDPGVDDWERALLAGHLGGSASRPVSLAPLFGQHGGLGALRAAAAALDTWRGMPSALVHGIARGGCRTALVVAAPEQRAR